MKFMNIDKRIRFIVGLIFIIILLAIYVCNINRESFKTQNVYIINDTDDGKKALIYNVTKFSKLPNELGNAIKFNGLNSYMVIPNVNLPTYSISLIFKQNTSTEKQILLSSSTGGFLVQIENQYLTYTMFSNTDSLKLAYKQMIELNQWYHLVLAYNGSKIQIFINGNLVEGEIKNTNFCKTIVVGTDTSKRFYFNGLVGKIQVLNKVLNLSEVCALHQMCKILKNETIEKVEEVKRKPKCKFIPAGDTLAKCSELCADKPNCNESICKNLCNNCDDEKYCAWLKEPEEDKTCKFVPYGPSKTMCINTCSKEKNCDYLNCQKICLNCQDPDMCRWIIPPKPKKEEMEPIEPPPKYDPEGKPLAPVISVKTYDKKVKVIWDRPYNGDAPIEAYVCFLFKTFKMNEGVRINMVPFPKCEECIHVIDELDPEETYSVGIRAYNKLGLSRMSNIESFIPKFNFKSAKTIKAPMKLPPISEYNFCNK